MGRSEEDRGDIEEKIPLVLPLLLVFSFFPLPD
jgi:hypothetical protein